MAVRVLIADDELLARKRLQRLLGALPGVEIVGEVQDGGEVLAAVRRGGVDVVLLDIHMPGLSGVEAMQLWPTDGPAIVFTTAHAEHALAAFEGGAIDYVLKPVDAGRLQKALERVRGRRASPPADRLALATRNGVVVLAAPEILAAVIDGATVTVHTDRGPFFTDVPLAELEARLGLRRVHRRALLHLDRVLRFEDNEVGGYTAVLPGGLKVEVSRAVARELRRAWGM